MKNKRKIIRKMNENKESDVKKYRWNTIPEGLKEFWNNYFNNQ